MRVRQRIMAIFLTVALLLTNTLSVAAARETTEPVPENTTTATLTVEKVGEGTVLCTGDGITETKESTYSVPVGTVVTIKTQPSEAYTTKQVLLNGSEIENSQKLTYERQNQCEKSELSEINKKLKKR